MWRHTGTTFGSHCGRLTTSTLWLSLASATSGSMGCQLTSLPSLSSLAAGTVARYCTQCQPCPHSLTAHTRSASFSTSFNTSYRQWAEVWAPLLTSTACLTANPTLPYTTHSVCWHKGLPEYARLVHRRVARGGGVQCNHRSYHRLDLVHGNTACWFALRQLLGPHHAPSPSHMHRLASPLSCMWWRAAARRSACGRSLLSS